MRVGMLRDDAGVRGKNEGCVFICGQHGGPFFVRRIDDFRTGAEVSWRNGFYCISGSICDVHQSVGILEPKFVVHYVENLARHDCTSPATHQFREDVRRF